MYLKAGWNSIVAVNCWTTNDLHMRELGSALCPNGFLSRLKKKLLNHIQIPLYCPAQYLMTFICILTGMLFTKVYSNWDEFWNVDSMNRRRNKFYNGPVYFIKTIFTYTSTEYYCNTIYIFQIFIMDGFVGAFASFPVFLFIKYYPACYIVIYSSYLVWVSNCVGIKIKNKINVLKVLYYF